MKRIAPAWIAFFVLVASVYAQPPRRPATQDARAAGLQRQMQEAYAGVNTFDATVTLSITTQDGRWQRVSSADYFVTFDRQGSRLRIDRPEVLLVSDGAKVRIASEQFPGRYVEVDAPRPLDYGALLGLVPFLSEPPMPETVPLLSGDPIAQLAGGTAAVQHVEPEADDAQNRPGLRFDTAAGVMTLRLDPNTHLVTGALLEIMAPDPTQSPLALVRYEVRQSAVNGALGDAFAFDTTGQTAVASLDALAQGQGGGGGVGPGHAHGAAPAGPAAAPPLSLQTLDGGQYQLKDETAKVVVLDFWAIWCPPCRESLPKIQKLHEWAKASGKPVAVYTVNLGDAPQNIREYMAKANLTLPVLMDPSNQAGDAFGVQAIPHTVVIADGKIVHVHTGYQADIDQVLQQQIETLLANPTPGDAPAQPAAPASSPPAPPTGAAPQSSATPARPAPPVDLPTLDGKAFSLAAEKADVVVLDFWATWCGPCVAALPRLQAVHDWAVQENKSVAVYPVNLRETPEQVRAFWNKHKLTMPTLLDSQGAVALAYRVTGIPTTVVIHRGTIAHVHVGFTPDMEDTLKRQIEALLAN